MSERIVPDRIVENPAAKLDEICEEFTDLDPRERLELLLDFAENIPPLPADYQAKRDAGENRVHECQTPVYLWVLPAGERVRIIGDVAPEAPTVKGFLGILIDAFDGARPADVLAVKPNLVSRLGLIEALGMTRMRGLNAMLGRGIL